MKSINRETLIKFHNNDLYEKLTIPLRQFYVEEDLKLDDALVLNQMVFSKKEVFTLNQIKKISLYEKGKPSLRKVLNRLYDKGFININKEAGRIYNQVEYSVTEKAFSHNSEIIGIVEGKDQKESGHYLTSLIMNKLRTFENSGLESIHMSVREISSLLGNIYSDSAVRLALKDLVDDDYISAELLYGIYNYKINLDKANNTFTPEELDNKSKILLSIYKKYLSKINIILNESDFKSYKLTFARMLENNYDFRVLKHILVFIRKNYKDYNDILTPSILRNSYDKLKDLSKALSKRKANRFLYKLEHNIFVDDELLEPVQKVIVEDPNLTINNEECSNIIDDYKAWDKAITLIDNIKEYLRKNFYKSSAGVTDIDFEDYSQQALFFAYEYFKTHKEEDKNIVNTISYKLKDFMYHKRNIQKNANNENVIINFEDDFQNIDIISFYNPMDLECEEDTNFEAIDTVLNSLTEKDKTIIKLYIGYDGETLTFKEIGKVIGHSESYTARRFKKSLLLLKEELGDKKVLENILNIKF